MKKKIALFIIILFILNTALIVNALRLPSLEYKEYTVEKGQKGEAALVPYTRTYIKLYETSRIDFSIFDPQTQQPLIHNSIIVEKVNSDGSLDIKIGIEGKDYIKTKILSGDHNQIKINFTTQAIPFMFISEYKYKYNEGATDNYAVLYFNVPMFSLIKNPNQPKNGIIDTTKITGGEVKTNYIPYLLILGIGLLIIAIILYSKKNKKERPAKKNSKKK